MSNDRLIIQGGKPLFGDVKISGAKNAVLPLISISLLFDKSFTLKNVPDLVDTRLMIKLINALGVMTRSQRRNWDAANQDLMRKRQNELKIADRSYYNRGELLRIGSG